MDSRFVVLSVKYFTSDQISIHNSIQYKLPPSIDGHRERQLLTLIRLCSRFRNSTIQTEESDDKYFEYLKKAQEDNNEEASQPKKTLIHLLKEEKKEYFLKVLSKINETKQKFLSKYVDVNRSIDIMVQEITESVKAREGELKSQLRRIASEKLCDLERQTLSCSAAIKYLNGSPTFFQDDVNLAAARRQQLNEDISFSDDNNITFDADSYSGIVKAIENLGKFSNENSLCVNEEPSDVINITPKFTFGSIGSEEGKFSMPWGVCSDPTGRILVCDRRNNRVQIFNECGEFLLEFGSEGSGPGEFNKPTGIDVDSDCRIYVADKDNHRIQVFSYSGHYLFSFGSQGSEVGKFLYPWDVSVSKGRIAVSDSKNHRIQLFSDSGYFLSVIDARKLGINNPKLATKYLDSPRGITFLPDGSLLVTDFNNHNILQVNNSFNGVKWMGSEGGDLGQFFRPQGIAFDGKGKFAVSDSKNYRVEVFDINGNFLESFGGKGSDPGQFNSPQGICFHSNRNIIVVDLENNRIQVF